MNDSVSSYGCWGEISSEVLLEFRSNGCAADTVRALQLSRCDSQPPYKFEERLEAVHPWADSTAWVSTNSVELNVLWSFGNRGDLLLLLKLAADAYPWYLTDSLLGLGVVLGSNLFNMELRLVFSLLACLTAVPWVSLWVSSIVLFGYAFQTSQIVVGWVTNLVLAWQSSMYCAKQT